MLSQKVGQCRPWLVSEIVRGVSTSVPVSASHYDVLGISPKATHSDIKSAYYKLSMLHHPDKSSDEVSVRKFRAITEAYEVLGNVNSKRLYDKTLAHGLRSAPVTYEQTEEESQDPVLRFHRSRMNRHMTATIHGKTPVYDFDAWTKHHYGELLKRTNEDKKTSRVRQSQNTIVINETEKEAQLYLLVFIVMTIIMLGMYAKTDYDRDMITRPPTAPSDAKT